MDSKVSQYTKGKILHLLLQLIQPLKIEIKINFPLKFSIFYWILT